MRVRLMVVPLALMVFAAAPLYADTILPPPPLADTQLADPAKEAQARELMLTLRCVVCQGQSIADSDSDMAGNMRALVRSRIADGDSPAKVRGWLVARYGDYITYDPPLSWATVPLWLAPFALLGLGLWVARVSFKRRRAG